MESKDILNYKHIYVVIRDEQVITIHTSRRNKRTYKKRFWHIGYIGFNEKTSHWCFLPEKNWTFGSDTLKMHEDTVSELIAFLTACMISCASSGAIISL